MVETKTEEQLKRICINFVKQIPYVVYEKGTFDEQSEVFPQKLDEEHFLTLSSEPERKRLNLSAVIFKSFCKNKNINVKLFPRKSFIQDSESLDELAFDVLHLMSVVLESFGIQILDYSTLDTDSEDSLSYLFTGSIDESQDLITEKMLLYGITLNEPLLYGDELYESADNQIIVFIQRSKLNDEAIAFLTEYYIYNELQADYFEKNCLITNSANDKGEEGVLLIYEWGCPKDGYYNNVAPFASIDLFRFCYMLIYLKEYQVSEESSST